MIGYAGEKRVLAVHVTFRHSVISRNRNSPIGTVAKLRTGEPRNGSSLPSTDETVCQGRLCCPPKVLSTRCRRVLPRLQSGLSVKLTSYLQVAPMLRLGGAIPPLPNMPSWRVQRQLNSLNELKLRVL